MSLSHQPKDEVLSPRNSMALDTLAGVRGEMARLYRLALNGRLRPGYGPADLRPPRDPIVP